MKNLKRLTTEELERLNSILVEAQRILNVDDKSLSEMNLEDDGLLINLIDVNLKVFSEVSKRFVAKENKDNRKVEAWGRIRKHLLNVGAASTAIAADSIITKVIDEISKTESMEEVEEIWDCEFGIEMDDLNDLMGW
jgi:hypothetical protein